MSEKNSKKKTSGDTTKKSVATIKPVRVQFELIDEPGKAVFVAGSFNDWEPSKKLLEKGAGVYRGFVNLPPGVYEYKFVIDGDWRLDEGNPNFIANDFGTLNSVLVVK